MPLSAAQKAANRKDISAGKPPRHFSSTPTLPADVNTIDTTYGIDEATALTAARDSDIKAINALIDLDILPPRIA